MLVSPALVQEMKVALAEVCPPDRMRIERVDLFIGPTPFAPTRALASRIEVGESLPTRGELHQRLEAAFPRYFKAPISDAHSSEFADAHAVALCVAKFAAALVTENIGAELGHGASPVRDRLAQCWIGYFTEVSEAHGLKVALIAVGCAVAEAADPAALLAPHLAKLEQIWVRRRPSDESLILMAAARARDIPILPIAHNHALWQFGWGKRSERFWVTSSNGDGLVTRRISSDKDVSKRHFRELGIPTPDWRLLMPHEDFRTVADQLDPPWAVKPFDGGAGKAVSANIQDVGALERAVVIARAASPFVLIEAHEPGDDYRLMVIDGRLAAAVRREPPRVVGDGKSSIRALIDALNSTRRGTLRETHYRSPVKDDAALAATLANQKVDQNSVPANGAMILLRTNANRSTGGTCTDVLDRVHPQIRDMAIQVTAAFGFRVTGLDYITTDISRSHDEVGGGFLETNSTPGMDVLLAGGMDEDEIGGLVLGALPGRIAVTLLIVPQALEEDVSELLTSRLGEGDAAAGKDWARIGSLSLPAQPIGPAARIEAVLRYPTVERLVILWPMEMVISHGLPLDKFERIICLGPLAEGRWRSLFQRHARELVCAGTPTAAVRASFDKAKST